MANTLVPTPRWLIDETCAQMVKRLKATRGPSSSRVAEYERLRALQHEIFAYHAPWPFFVRRMEFDGLGLA